MTKNYLLAVLAVMLCLSVRAQQTRTQTSEIIRCYTTEADAARRAADPKLGTLDDFERWMRPLVTNYEANAASQRAVTTIPIIFHIIHNNGSDNIDASYVNAQIAQLNEDFRKTGDGYNNHPDGADSEIEFCAATLDENGNLLPEPGINRVNRSSAGFSTPPYSQSYYESTIKPSTIWDPTQYCNVWVSDLSGGLLGYAQFPEASSLGGIGTGNGGANTDGVVVLYSSVGSIANPHPQGGVYAAGRTLTHELGHWLGLRHIWGDGGCSVDDYCDDTPRASGSTSGCPSNQNTCNDISYGASSDPNDMVENYMDYSYDACMNIFTNDQKARMQVVLSSSIRRASLASSGKCGGGVVDNEAPSTPTNLTASNIAQTTATLSWTASTDNIGVSSYDISLNGSVIGSTSGTSANLTGLTASTTYAATVVAKDAAGNTSGAASTSFTTLDNVPGSCASENLILSITFDNYPEETSWSITNSSGSTVESGGTYGSQADGSTLNINLTLADGNYTFTINDAYGDGICCSYGSGSYSLSSGGTSFASGGSFGSTESTSFCVEGGGPQPDTESPTTPLNVSVSSITQTTATASWGASSDNVGVTGYEVFLNGSSIGTTTNTSASLTGLTASTSYTVGVRAFDAAGNTSNTATASFTTLAAPDTESPTTPLNVTASNITQTTATASWGASTDNFGVTGYEVFLNGSSIGTTTNTSAGLTGLTASTSYTVGVRAFDAAGNTSNTATTSFVTLDNPTSNCASENLTLSITFDNYPEETSWSITNASGSTVESGGTYGSQADGSTLNINLTLADGNYTFTINDAYGDGICCGYGNGSYSLTSGGTSYANGGSFGSSESTNFCVEGSGGPTPDTEAPSTPTNVTASNVTQTSADISWSASSDNVGVVAYEVFVNGSSVGTTTSTSTSLTGLTANTTYTVGVVASDAAGNSSATGSTSFTTLSNGGGTGTEEIFGHYFESGWDGWSDGGSDCARYSGSRSYEGNYSIRLRDNSSSSIMTLSNVNVSGYDELELTFYFYSYSMEVGEDFWVRFNDGSGWQTVASYARGTNFNNNTFYSASVTLSANDFNFGSSTQFRFQCDASNNADYIYIDEVVLTGITNTRSNGSYYSAMEVEGPNNGFEMETEAFKESVVSQNELVLYPNPASTEITIKTNFEDNVVRIFSISGVLVQEFRLAGSKTTIDVSSLEAGTYIIQAEAKEGVAISKFIKQ